MECQRKNEIPGENLKVQETMWMITSSERRRNGPQANDKLEEGLSQRGFLLLFLYKCLFILYNISA